MLRGWPLRCAAAIIVLLLVLVSAPQAAAEGGNCTQACVPWVPTGYQPCVRRGRIPLRFSVDIATESQYRYPAGTGPLLTNVTYAFCPMVDEMQAFSLQHAPLLATSYGATHTTPFENYVFTQNLQPKYLSVYGFGMSDEPLVPERGISAGAVVIAENGTFPCNEPSYVAVVETLILTIGLQNGFFSYNTVLNTTSNITTPAQPTSVGFSPTCDSNDVCVMGSDMVCVGDPGVKNCARCYASPSELINATLQVWTSYFGSDRKNRAMLSGGSNPMNYRQFAGSSFLNNIASTLHEWQKGMPTLPTIAPVHLP